MILLELFDSKVDIEYLKDTGDRLAAVAKIGERFIMFGADREKIKIDNKEIWEIVFSETENHPTDEASRKLEFPKFELTGSGNELQVFAMVGECLKHLVAKRNPGIIRFTSSKEGNSDKRAKLYERLCRKYLPEYKLTVNRDGSVNTKFWLEKE